MYIILYLYHKNHREIHGDETYIIPKKNSHVTNNTIEYALFKVEKNQTIITQATVGL